MNPEAVKSSVQTQFNRCARHYLKNSPMADRELLRLIVQLAEPKPFHHTLDVACGAGFLVGELAPFVAQAVGVDLSETMLAEATQSALGLANVRFQWADAEALPFADQTFDIVSCKLALHYFPSPLRAIGEMQRVAKREARLVLIDRVSSEDRRRQEFHNRIEKLRTPAKIKVYSTSEIIEILDRQGFSVTHVQHYEQHQTVDKWLQTTGAPEENRHRARALLLQCLEDDLAGLKVRREGERLVLTHTTAILVAESVGLRRATYSRGSAGAAARPFGL